MIPSGPIKGNQNQGRTGKSPPQHGAVSRSPFGSILRNFQVLGSGCREDIWPVPAREALLGPGQAEGTTLHCDPSGSGAGAEPEFICMASAPRGLALLQVLSAFPLYCLVNVSHPPRWPPSVQSCLCGWSPFSLPGLISGRPQGPQDDPEP